MPERLPEEKRQAIAAAIRAGAGEVTCRGIAREFGVSTGTVRNIVRDESIPDPFSRAKTAHATRARVTDMAARRAALAERLIQKAEHILERLDSPYTLVVGTADGLESRVLDEPPLKEVKDGMAAVGTAINSHMALIKFDTKEASNPLATSLVDSLAKMLELDQGNDEQVDDGYPTPLPDLDALEAAALATAEAETAADDGYAAPDPGAWS
jgi:transposase-like protein